MSTSDIIQLSTSIVAILISVAALIRSVMSDRNAQKPYIVAFLKRVRNTEDTQIWYLVIKNFGKTGAYIQSVTSEPEIKSGDLKFENNPFSSFKNHLIAPGQSYLAGIGIHAYSTPAELETKEFDLTIQYKDDFGKNQKVKYHIDANELTNIEHFVSVPGDADPITKAIYFTGVENLLHRL